ncbi:Methyltransferase domain-containing protein [Amycolatopsis arida]|uniref:Methyltransferase domain-containing protein n=1 Tax=Amycolatopsis arida TaxID=587909 RepID=A0A1I5YF17_9PSEU|nr:class I SAM-dependent methyltransferase [Amycolatopsis arida]TDX90466.1 methyltransferase family protein [Amycolatopsis arida]SFQ42763.1 Methyltransferase domain-containing protein [Amycolatopsis arida]
MSEPEFDVDGVFGDDYLYFFLERVEERSAADVDLVWRLLELEPGMEVLDLACGHGRIANRLAARGCRVTGLDYTRVFLERARADAAEQDLPVEYVHGDMRSLPWTGRFDRIVCWLNSFCLFDDEGIRRVLASAAAALRPGGRLGMETANYPFLARNSQRADVVDRDGDMVVDRQRLDPLTNRSVIDRTFVRGGRTRRSPFFIRLFTFPELRDWLRGVGFGTVHGYGEDGAPLTAEHRRMITLATL